MSAAVLSLIKIFRGETGIAGEIGHITIDTNGSSVSAGLLVVLKHTSGIII